MEQKKDSPSVGKYICIKTVGKSKSSKVKLAIDTEKNEKVAVKIVKITKTSQETELALKHEYEVMKSLSHKNILKVYDYIEKTDYLTRKGTKLPVAILAMELAQGGELFSYMPKPQPYTEDEARSFFHELIEVIQFLHLQGICHGNIKPENLLFDNDFNLKITDFGRSINLANPTPFDQYSDSTSFGFYSPEKLAKHKNYDVMGEDLFAAAIVLFNMVIGSPPFSSANINDLRYKHLVNNRNDIFWDFHEKGKKSKSSKEFKDLMNSMLAFDPTQRLTLSEIKAHPWYLETSPSKGKFKALLKEKKKANDEKLEKQKVGLIQLKQAKTKSEEDRLEPMIERRAFTGFNQMRDLELDTSFESHFTVQEIENLEKPRKLLPHDNDIYKSHLTLYSSLEVTQLFKHLAMRAHAVFNEYTVHPEYYQIKGRSLTDSDEVVKIKLVICKVDEDINCIEFLRESGPVNTYYEVLQEELLKPLQYLLDP